jgi:23S rRNA A2030 N6-methylase RlmJ
MATYSMKRNHALNHYTILGQPPYRESIGFPITDEMLLMRMDLSEYLERFPRGSSALWYPATKKPLPSAEATQMETSGRLSIFSDGGK